MELTDTHCHIYLSEFDNDRREAIERAFSAGVTRIFLPNVDESTTGGLLDLTGQYPGHFFPMVGLHPTSVGTNYAEQIRQLDELRQRHRFVGIGEIGLDLYWDKTYRKEQEEAFRIQLHWAAETNLPVVIHVREAHDETISAIRNSGLTNLRGIFHCFTGTIGQAETITGMGFHLGIGGVSTFRNSGLDQVLPHISPKQIVLETDSPYLAPVPHRGKRNEPAYLNEVLLKVASIYGMEPVELAHLTTETSKHIFGV